jgi:flagellar biosynthesis chaperone FliJ
MRKFHFRAATVLELRQRQYRTAQAELLRSQQVRDMAAGAVRDAEASVSRAQSDYRERLVAGDGAVIFERHRNWIAGQYAVVESRRRLLVEQQLLVERAAADVRRTHRLARVLERLRDRAWKAYQKEARRQETIELDELAVIQFARRMGGST